MVKKTAGTNAGGYAFYSQGNSRIWSRAETYWPFLSILLGGGWVTLTGSDPGKLSSNP
jgi:hypothetical protein